MAQISVEESIKEMKEVIIGLYRSAGNLDSIIREIEDASKREDVSPDRLESTVKYLYRLRTDYRLKNQTNNEEADAWMHLLKATRKKEEA